MVHFVNTTGIFYHKVFDGNEQPLLILNEIHKPFFLPFFLQMFIDGWFMIYDV